MTCTKASAWDELLGEIHRRLPEHERLREEHRLRDHWRRSIRSHLAETWRFWLIPWSSGMSMSLEAESFARVLHRISDLSESQMSAVIEATRFARRWMLESQSGEWFEELTRAAYRPLWRRAARAIRHVRVQRDTPSSARSRRRQGRRQ